MQTNFNSLLKHTIKSLILSVFISNAAFALESQIESTVPDVSIPNVHALAPNVFRGNEPLKYMSDLETMGITDVVIFKTDTRGEVAKEIALLKEMDKKSQTQKTNVTHIAFPWKDIEDYETACEDTMTALQKLLSVAKNKNRRVFFHCTVGEDRTGLLAGLFRIAHDEWEIEEAFQEEMCARGYEAGNNSKPYNVVKAIRDDLTPLYLAVASAIIEAKNNGQKINKSICSGLEVDHDYDRKKYTCD